MRGNWIINTTLITVIIGTSEEKDMFEPFFASVGADANFFKAIWQF